MQASDGEVRHFQKGDVELVEETTGKGHRCERPRARVAEGVAVAGDPGVGGVVVGAKEPRTWVRTGGASAGAGTWSSVRPW
jgi:hypothetical protein